MNYLEYARMAVHHLKSNLLRSILTMLGIVIGIGSIIGVLSIGEGGRIKIDKELQKFGINRLGIYPTKSSSMGFIPFSLEDIDVLRNRVQGIRTITPLVYKSGEITYRDEKLSIDVVGTDHNLSQVEEIDLESGRFLSEMDIRFGRKVIVLSEKTAEKLFRNHTASGGGDKKQNWDNVLMKRIYLQKQAYTVIGIQKASEAPFVEHIMKDKVYIPITAFQQTYNTKWISEISMTVFKSNDIDRIAEQSINVLERRHNAKDNYKSYNLVKEMELARKILYTFSMVIGAIAAISLLVGGIGVMNIMLVTVTERTREIGIRKALGATNKQIMIQFLMESLTISILGGIFGTCVGILFTIVASNIIRIPTVVSVWTILVATLFSAGIGLFFGLYPARKASNLDPIAALRYD